MMGTPNMVAQPMTAHALAAPSMATAFSDATMPTNDNPSQMIGQISTNNYFNQPTTSIYEELVSHLNCPQKEHPELATTSALAIVVFISL